jgi:hypothetical protein
MDTYAMTMTLETVPSRLNRLAGAIPTAQNKDYAEILMNVPASIFEFDLRASEYRKPKKTEQVLKYVHTKTEYLFDTIKSMRDRKSVYCPTI